MQKVGHQDAFRLESRRSGLQEVEVLAEVERYHDNAYRKDVLHEEECHADTDGLSVRTDVPHRGDGRAVIVTDVWIDSCYEWHDKNEA